jgi:uncharacterized protein (DUF58 family)
VLSADDARLLDGLLIGAASAPAVANAAGHRRARSRGVGVEFHEYRHYQPGDDPRSIDWTVEARLQQLVVRVSRAGGDLRLHLLLDVSRSMSIGRPDKLSCARHVAAALSYVAIERRDLVGLATFDDAIRTVLPPVPGRSQLFRTLQVLQGVTAAGVSSVDDALLHYGAAVRGPGLAVVLSDFFVPGAGLQGLRYLLHRGLTPAVVQIVAAEELRPEVDDVLEIVDVERPHRKIMVDPATLASYRARLAEHNETLRSFCLAQGCPWLQLESAMPFRAIVGALEASGLFSAAV